MKATDLMCGDWVYCYGKPTKISILTNANIIATEIGDGVITPIPLTAEILEENKVMDKNKVSCQEMTKGLLYSRNENSYSISILFQNKVALVMAIQYAHELQHALRLCGLNKLADNFKI